MLSHCIHSLYFSTGIKQHRCRLPGVSALELTPFGTSEIRLEPAGRRENTEGVCPDSCSVRGTIQIVYNMTMCADNTIEQQGCSDSGDGKLKH